jgi:hypothetical protein
LCELCGISRATAHRHQQTTPAASFVLRNNTLHIRTSEFARICADTGHSAHLFALATETSGYVCAAREFARFASNALSTTKSTFAAFSGVSAFVAGGLPWFKESDVLSLFGLSAVSRPEELLVSRGTGVHRCMYDTVSEQILTSAMRLTANRYRVLSPEAAICYVQKLLSRPMPANSPFGLSLVTAADQLFRLTNDALCNKCLLLARALCEATATALASLPFDDCVDELLTAPLASLSAELGSIVRYRVSAIATQAVSRGGTEALAKLSLSRYLATNSEPISRSFFASALDVSCETTLPARRQRANWRWCENLDETHRELAARQAAMAMVSDALMRSTNKRFLSPFFWLLSTDLSGTCACLDGVCAIL